jgi:hypothetical protein
MKKSPAGALSKPLGAGFLPARSLFTQNGIKLVVTRTIMPFCHLRVTAHHPPVVFVRAERQDVTAQVDGGSGAYIWHSIGARLKSIAS